MSFLIFACSVFALSPWLQEHAAPRELDDPQLQPRINAAIDRGIEHLLAEQHRDGSWTGQAFRAYKAGPTAFAAYVLVESGVDPNSPAIRNALDYLRRTPPTMVYSAGAILLLLAELPESEREVHEDLAQDCLDKLIGWEDSGLRGTWSYPSGPVDLSNMQFVALGFWAAQRLGLDVPRDVVQRLVEATIERFQEDPYDAEGHDGRESKIAGFHYFTERDRRVPSASMTAAGICIQRIARVVSGKKLGRKLLRAMDESEALGLRWLDAHWSMTENFGHHEGQLLYYLWALERLGAFYGSHTIEGHRWYEPGAQTILDEQATDGGWGRLHGTGYALLFLGRASGSVVSGGAARRRDAVWSLDTGPVRLHANGRTKITGWITGLECEAPFYVETVEWSVDGEVHTKLEADDPTRAWDGERFAFQIVEPTIGAHTIDALVTVRLADGQGLELTSETLTVECLPSPEEWMRRARHGLGENLLAGLELAATASTNAAGQDAARAVDGFEGTAWVAGDEPAPRIEVTLPDKGVRARSVTLSAAGSSFAQRASFVGLESVRVTVNGKPYEHRLEPSSPGTAVLPLPKRVRVKSLVVEILAPVAGRRGIAEIGLR